MPSDRVECSDLNQRSHQPEKQQQNARPMPGMFFLSKKRKHHISSALLQHMVLLSNTMVTRRSTASATIVPYRIPYRTTGLTVRKNQRKFLSATVVNHHEAHEADDRPGNRACNTSNPPLKTRYVQTKTMQPRLERSYPTLPRWPRGIREEARLTSVALTPSMKEASPMIFKYPRLNKCPPPVSVSGGDGGKASSTFWELHCGWIDGWIDRPDGQRTTEKLAPKVIHIYIYIHACKRRKVLLMLPTRQRQCREHILTHPVGEGQTSLMGSGNTDVSKMR